MLKKIPTIMSPEAVRLMMEMGHGDTLLIADANYPATTNNPRVVRADGHKLTDLLSAVMELFPLDAVVDAPVTLMATADGSTPPVWEEFRTIITEAGDDREFTSIERFDFYEAGAKAAGIIQSGDTALYGNILLQKGTI